jgi:hypothetical protein
VEEQFMAFGQPALPEMRLELVPVPVADVDRAKAFSEQAGSELAETNTGEDVAVRARAALRPA